MTIPSRSASLLAARTGLTLVALSFALLCVWKSGDLLGQAPAQKKQRNEEEEDTPKKPNRKVIRIEEEENAKNKPEANRPAAPAVSADLPQLAQQEKHPAIKALFESLAVPHDRVLFQRTSVTQSGERKQRAERILPTPYYLGNDPGRHGNERLRFTTLTKDFKEDTPLSPDLKTLESVRPYEEIAQENVKSFLHEASQTYGQKDEKDPEYLSRGAVLQAAVQALSAVLRWHESAVLTGKRKGNEWDKVGAELRSRLLEVLLEQMGELAKVQDWDKVQDLMRRLVGSYGNTDKRIFEPVRGMLQRAINSPTSSPEDRQQAFKRLHDLAMEFPDNKVLEPLVSLNKSHAQSLLERATELAKDKRDVKKLEQAREYLKWAEETWPQLEGLSDLRAQIGMDYPILRVGVRRQLPKFFAPVRASTDNERRIVELLFESLIKLVPDQSGGFFYRPTLAEFSPQVIPLGRQFDLPRNAFWSNGQPLTAADIQLSLRLCKNGKGVGLSRAWGDLLEEKVEPTKNPFQLKLRLKQGLLDPLAPMSFKIVPRDEFINRDTFATNPVSSGPFRLASSGQSDETRRETLIFRANPAYGQRPTKRGTPHIQEVRFYAYADNTDLVKEFKSRNLDLVLDLTAQEAEQLQQNQTAGLVVPMPSPAVPNRRIYFLAINTNKLDDPKLRQALSSAINREDLLNKHFRGKLKGVHKALHGPFPAGCWACKPLENDKKDSQGLHDPNLAKLQKTRPPAGPFQLKYAADNPAVDEAMKELCAQVKELTGVELAPARCDAYTLRNDVENVKDYDLAYYHYDFTDAGYWLAPLFRPPPGTEDNHNIFKYENEKLVTLLTGMKSYRDFTKVQEYQWEAQDLLNRETPFIPLWQLDPLMAFRRNVQPSSFDPLLVFDNIEDWHLLPK